MDDGWVAFPISIFASRAPYHYLYGIPSFHSPEGIFYKRNYYCRRPGKLKVFVAWIIFHIFLRVDRIDMIQYNTIIKYYRCFHDQYIIYYGREFLFFLVPIDQNIVAYTFNVFKSLDDFVLHHLVRFWSWWNSKWNSIPLISSIRCPKCGQLAAFLI